MVYYYNHGNWAVTGGSVTDVCTCAQTVPSSAATSMSYVAQMNYVTSATASTSNSFPIQSLTANIPIYVNQCTNTPHEIRWDDRWDSVQVMQTGQQEPMYELRYGYIHDDTWEKLEGFSRFKDFAPLCEWIEINKKGVKQWLKKMAKDPTYLRQQVLANLRHDILYEFGTDIHTHWHNRYPHVQDIKEGRAISFVNKLLQSLGKLTDEETRLLLDEWKTAIGVIKRERSAMIKAHENSLKLLKKWLTTEEWNQIKNNGQMAIPSKLDKNTIYIVKKDAKEMVEVYNDKKYKHKLCLHLTDQSLPVGDQLLAKILLLKTDEQRFLKTANIHK